ncbi:MAG: hypothetical protein WBP12_04065 [Candidatus Saccharimonas sp.]
MEKLPSIEDIKVFNTEGSWSTKSGGSLSVLYKLGYDTVQAFLTYDQKELDEVGVDIRGLRSYVVENIPKGSVGANEWHRIRNEICFSINGSFRWLCRDVYGNEREFIVDKNSAILTPHHILHTYTALEDNTSISVLANTLFTPDIPSTHDTYPAATFPRL